MRPTSDAALPFDTRRLASLLAHALPVMLTYAVLRRVFFRAALLPDSAYEEWSIFAAALQTPRFWILLLPAALLFWRLRDLTWDRLRGVPGLRWFIFCVCLVITWALATTDRNLFYDRGYPADRIALVVLLGLVLYRPVFVWTFLALSMSYVFQLEHAIDGFGWLDKVIVFECLLLFCSMLALQSVRRQHWLLFPMLLAGLLASDYVIPAIAKLRIEWLQKTDLFALTVSTYANGWLSFIPQDKLLSWVKSVGWANPYLKVGTWLIEFGALFILSSRRYFFAIVALTASLHVAIFVTSGIFFWKWILLNAALFGLVWRMGRERSGPMFGWRPVALTALVVLTSPWHLQPTWLAWYDSNLHEYFDFQAVGASGAVYPIGRDWMAPYDLIFSQNRFFYLTDEPFLTGTFGSIGSDTRLYDLVQECRTPEDVHALLRQHGEVRFKAGHTARFDRFIRRWFGALNRGSPKGALFSGLKAPYHIWSFPEEPAYALQEPVTEVRVWLHRELYVEHRLVPVSSKRIRTIPIPHAEGARPAPRSASPR